ncbi:MAG: tyrosine-type recombinase/integrase [Anaerolineaceae bacterium]|nr:tyrosine-type recombinase/integrase [Anaerolineaceae bacterium]
MLPEIEAFQKWLRRKSPHSSTQIHYPSDLVLFFAWVEKLPSQITLQDIDRFIEHSQQVPHSIATINRRLAALRSFYLFLTIEREDAPRNPVLPRRHFIHQAQRLPRDVEDAQIEKLFAVITSLRDRAIFLLMLRCGLRVGEVRNLSLADLYLQPSRGSLPRVWLHGKGGAQRVAYLSAQSLTALHAWLAIRPNGNEPAVFLNRFGKRMTVTGIQDRLAHACRATKVWITCHQLRHTFGHHLTEAHVPVTTIQRLLGHARLRTTEIYLHISDRQVQEDYDAAMREIARRFPLLGGEQ